MKPGAYVHRQLKGLVQQGTWIHFGVQLSYPLRHVENMLSHLIISLWP